MLYEIYNDEQAFEAHQQTPHFKKYVAEAVPLLASRERQVWKRRLMDLQARRAQAPRAYKLLIGLVIPRPIAWISTRSANGVANCAPFSFFNVFSEDPPLCVVGINPRSDGAMKHTLKNIRRTREFVVNLVDEATANAMHLSSDEFTEDESEFEKTGLTPVAGALVQHPRIAEAAASLECRLYPLLEISATRELVLGEILLVHARDGIIDPETKRISETALPPDRAPVRRPLLHHAPALQPARRIAIIRRPSTMAMISGMKHESTTRIEYGPVRAIAGVDTLAQEACARASTGTFTTPTLSGSS